MGESEKPAKATTSWLREALSSLWILDPLPAGAPSKAPLTRLAAAPKHHLCDPAIAAHVLGITDDWLLSPASGASEFFGQLVESLATLTVRASAQACESSAFRFRTRGGDQEVGRIGERLDGRVFAFEVKLEPTIAMSGIFIISSNALALD